MQSMLPRGRQDLRNEAPIIVVEHRQWDPTEERKCMDVTINPSLGNRSRIGPYKASIAVRQVQREEVSLLLHAANHHHGFTEVGLGMARSMSKWHKHLSAAPTVFTDVVLDRRVAALERMLICYPAVDTQYRREGRSRSKTRLAVWRCLRLRLRSSVSNWSMKPEKPSNLGRLISAVR